MAKTRETQTKANYDYRKNRKVKDWGENITVPNQSKSVRELMDRIVTGRPISDIEVPDGGSEDPEKISFDEPNPFRNTEDPLTEMDMARDKIETINIKLGESKKVRDKVEAEKKREEEKTKLKEEIEAENASEKDNLEDV